MGRRSPAPSDEGITLVELLVAMFILGIVMAGTAAAMTSSLATTRQNGSRTVAANLANEEMERLLTDTYAEVAALAGTNTGTATVQGIDYTVTSEIFTVDASVVPGACSVASGLDSDVLRIDVSVGWPMSQGQPPAHVQTTMSPPIGLYDPTLGQLVVYVADTDNPRNPVGGVTVTATSPTHGTFYRTTSADGCAVFEQLEADNYTVSVNRSGYVDLDQEATPQQITTVPGGQRVGIEFAYTEAVDLTLTPTGLGGGILPSTGLGLTLSNTNGTWTRTYPDGAASATYEVYPEDYKAWAGTCSDSDPEGTASGGNPWWPGATRPDSIATPGSGTLDLASLVVEWGDTTLPDLTVQLQATRQCEDGTTIVLDFPAVSTAADVTLAMPYGNGWSITATSGGASDAADATPLSPTLDYTPRASGGDPPFVIIDLDVPVCVPVEPAFVGESQTTMATNYVTYFGTTYGRSTVTIPGGVQAGDLMILSMAGYGTETWKVFNGWELQETTTVSSSYEFTVSTFAKRATSSDVGGAFYVYAGSSEYGTLHLSAFRGFDTGGSITTDERSQTSTTAMDIGQNGGVTVQQDDSLLYVAAGSREDNRNLRVTSPSVQIRYLQKSVSGGADVAHVIGAEVIDGGASGTRRVLIDNSSDVTGHMLLFQSRCQ